MKRDELLARLRDLKPWFEDHGIIRVRVFGSHARDEAGPDSDVDLLVEFAETPSLLSMIGLERSLGEKLGCQVDLATERGLKPRARAPMSRQRPSMPERSDRDWLADSP